MALALNMLIDLGFQREMSFTKKEKNILTCIYFTSIVLQIQKKKSIIIFKPTTTHGVRNQLSERLSVSSI